MFTRRHVIVNAAFLHQSGHYVYLGPSSTTITIPSSSQTGDHPGDEQVYRLDHAGADGSVVTLSVSGTDVFASPDVPGAIGQNYGTNGLQQHTATTAGAFVIGQKYTIVSVGTTDFTLIGAASNTVGVAFTATGVGTGSGTANITQSLVTLKMVKGDTLFLTLGVGRIWMWALVNNGWRRGRVKAVTAAYTVSLFDSMIRADGTSGAYNVTLPTAASAFTNGCGQIVTLKKTDAGANAVSLKGNGAELIDASNTKACATQYSSVTVQSNGTSWDITAVI